MTYFLDNANLPVLNGDSYAELAKIDQLLSYHPRWQYLDVSEKELAIISASAQIDLQEFKGEVSDISQPMQFPRNISDCDNYSIEVLSRIIFVQVVYPENAKISDQGNLIRVKIENENHTQTLLIKTRGTDKTETDMLHEILKALW